MLCFFHGSISIAQQEKEISVTSTVTSQPETTSQAQQLINSLQTATSILSQQTVAMMSGMSASNLLTAVQNAQQIYSDTTKSLSQELYTLVAQIPDAHQAGALINALWHFHQALRRFMRTVHINLSFRPIKQQDLISAQLLIEMINQHNSDQQKLIESLQDRIKNQLAYPHAAHRGAHQLISMVYTRQTATEQPLIDTIQVHYPWHTTLLDRIKQAHQTKTMILVLPFTPTGDALKASDASEQDTLISKEALIETGQPIPHIPQLAQEESVADIQPDIAQEESIEFQESLESEISELEKSTDLQHDEKMLEEPTEQLIDEETQGFAQELLIEQSSPSEEDEAELLDEQELAQLQETITQADRFLKEKFPHGKKLALSQVRQLPTDLNVVKNMLYSLHASVQTMYQRAMNAQPQRVIARLSKPVQQVKIFFDTEGICALESALRSQPKLSGRLAKWFGLSEAAYHVIEIAKNANLIADHLNYIVERARSAEPYWGEDCINTTHRIQTISHQIINYEGKLP